MRHITRFGRRCLSPCQSIGYQRNKHDRDSKNSCSPVQAVQGKPVHTTLLFEFCRFYRAGLVPQRDSLLMGLFPDPARRVSKRKLLIVS
jgi:hypothetical protein